MTCLRSARLPSTDNGCQHQRLRPNQGDGSATGASDLVENAVLPLDACEGEDFAGALMIVGAEVGQVCGFRVS